MEIPMKGNGLMIKQTEKENILIMKFHMMDIGKMINKMGLELKLGKMVLSIVDFILMEKKKVKENLFGLMDLLMKENLKIIFLMEKEHLFGIIKENMKVLGKIIK